jgi:hypothetical protein
MITVYTCMWLAACWIMQDFIGAMMYRGPQPYHGMPGYWVIGVWRWCAFVILSGILIRMIDAWTMVLW